MNLAFSMHFLYYDEETGISYWCAAPHSFIRFIAYSFRDKTLSIEYSDVKSAFYAFCIPFVFPWKMQIVCVRWLGLFSR